MKKIIGLILACFFLLSSSCQASGSSGKGHIVYSAVDDNGKPLSELVVLDANGKELRRVELPDDEKYGNLFIPFAYHHPSGQAFIYAPGGTNYLVDVASGEVKPIREPGVSNIQGDTNTLNTCPMLSNAGEHWTVLCRDLAPYLVNLETGEVYAGLPRPNEDQILPFDIAFSPDQTYLTLRTKEGVFVLPSASPEEIRQVGENDKIQHVGFSSDNKHIVYIRPADPQGYEVVVENIDGSELSVMHTSEKWLHASFVPGQNQILVAEREKILLLSLSNSIEQEFPTLATSDIHLFFSPDGQQALVGYNDFDAGVYRWQWLELKRGIAEEIPELEGYQANQVVLRQRWMTLNDKNSGHGREVMHVASLDLQTGSVKSLATLENVIQYWENSTSADGKFRTTIVMQDEGPMQLWLLDLTNGKARLLAEDTTVRGEISPDGKLALVWSRHKDGEQDQNMIEIQDTSGKTIKDLGEGFAPFWVWP
jgi:hypothetical protein